MISVAQLIFSALTESGTGLFALIGTRAWLGHAPRAGAGKFTNTVKAVVFTPLPSGRSHASGAQHNVTVEFKSYGGSEDALDAEEVHRALWDRLQLISGTWSGRTIKGGTEALAGTLLSEPDTGYPVYTGQFTFQMEE